MNSKIILQVRANKDVPKDIYVPVRVDTTALWRNEVTLFFDNRDYCDVNIRKFYTVGRYITTYETMYAVDAFIEQIKTGKITIEQCKVNN